MLINPIIRGTKFKKLYDSYINNKNIISESIDVKHFTPSNPHIGSVKTNNGLTVSESHFNEKQILREIGLMCESTDIIYSIKDSSGSIKAAMSLKCDDIGSIKEINYIDSDDTGLNFKHGISKLISIPNCLSFKSPMVDVNQNGIKC